MCEDDLSALRRLEEIFTRAANNDSKVQVTVVEPAASPRVESQDKSTRTRAALTSAIAEIAAQPRVELTTFTPIQEDAPPPRVEATDELIVAYPRAVVASKPTDNSIPAITQDEDSLDQAHHEGQHQEPQGQEHPSMSPHPNHQPTTREAEANQGH